MRIPMPAGLTLILNGGEGPHLPREIMTVIVTATVEAMVAGTVLIGIVTTAGIAMTGEVAEGSVITSRPGKVGVSIEMEGGMEVSAVIEMVVIVTVTEIVEIGTVRPPGRDPS